MLKSANIHLLWIIAILIGVVSVLLWRLPNGSQLSGYISFAASISSLILAVVAIFQALLSSHGLETSISDIRSSAKSIADETVRLNAASVSLGGEAEQALKRLETLPDQLSLLKGELGEKLDKIEVQAFSKLSDDTSSVVDNCEDWHKGRPYGYILALYALALSNKTYKAIDLNSIIPEQQRRGVRQYITGVITAVKYNRIYKISIDGTSEYLATSLGELDRDNVISIVRDLREIPVPVRLIVRSINQFFELDWIPEISATEEENMLITVMKTSSGCIPTLNLAYN